MNKLFTKLGVFCFNLYRVVLTCTALPRGTARLRSGHRAAPRPLNPYRAAPARAAQNRAARRGAL